MPDGECRITRTFHRASGFGRRHRMSRLGFGRTDHRMPFLPATPAGSTNFPAFSSGIREPCELSGTMPTTFCEPLGALVFHSSTQATLTAAAPREAQRIARSARSEGRGAQAAAPPARHRASEGRGSGGGWRRWPVSSTTRWKRASRVEWRRNDDSARKRCHRRPWHGGRSSRATRRSCGTRGCGARVFAAPPAALQRVRWRSTAPDEEPDFLSAVRGERNFVRAARAGCASWRTGSRRRSSSSTTASPRAAAASPTTSRSSTRPAAAGAARRAPLRPAAVRAPGPVPGRRRGQRRAAAVPVARVRAAVVRGRRPRRPAVARGERARAAREAAGDDVEGVAAAAAGGARRWCRWSTASRSSSASRAATSSTTTPAARSAPPPASSSALRGRRAIRYGGGGGCGPRFATTFASPPTAPR